MSVVISRRKAHNGAHTSDIWGPRNTASASQSEPTCIRYMLSRQPCLSPAWLAFRDPADCAKLSNKAEVHHDDLRLHPLPHTCKAPFKGEFPRSFCRRATQPAGTMLHHHHKAQSRCSYDRPVLALTCSASQHYPNTAQANTTCVTYSTGSDHERHISRHSLCHHTQGKETGNASDVACTQYTPLATYPPAKIIIA